MNIVGIVAEYNPFHNGHAYQIKKAKELTGCDAVFVAMSGDFVQRGAPAVIDKELRTFMALSCGADVILQIPVIYSTASAETFAYGSVALLAAAGIDTLVFGCEDDDTELLQSLAELYITEPEDYQKLLRSFLKEGLSYPIARSRATIKYFTSNHICENGGRIEDVLKKPNNILAIEYLKALKCLEKEGRLSKPIKICPIKRIGTDYHSLETSEGICSATAIRQMLYRDRTLSSGKPEILSSSDNGYNNVLNEQWANFIPSNNIAAIDSYLKTNTPVYEDDFSNELLYCLIRQKKAGFAHFAEGNEEISNRVLNCLSEYDTFSSFSKRLQTKDITYARISRFLLHILLDVSGEYPVVMLV